MKPAVGRFSSWILASSLAVICLGATELNLVEMQPSLRRGTTKTRESWRWEKLPLDFVENRGQWGTPAKFVARKGPIAASFEPAAIRLHLGEHHPAPLTLTFEGASEDVALLGEAKRGGHYNFFIGKDPARWRSKVPAYGSILYRGLYDGVDVRVREEAGRLEYDLMLAPGTDLEQVVIRTDGTTGLEVASDGSLILKTASGSLRQTPPRTWEVLPTGEKRPLESRVRKIDAQRYGFDVPGRDRRLALVVDPGIEWATFVGGSGADTVGGVAVAPDGTGDVIVAGWTNSGDFPLFNDPSFGGFFGERVFVARLNPTGSTLLYATFVGGWHSQIVYRGLAVNTFGDAAVVGETTSPDFPTTPAAFDQTAEGRDAFAFLLNPTGGLVFSTFLGGFADDKATAVAFDPAGEIIIGGSTASADFPVTPGAFDETYNTPNDPSQGGAPGDMFITRLSPISGSPTYSTFLGGPSIDVLEDLAVDPQGHVNVVGWVTGNSVQTFVTTPGAFDTTWNGSQDAAFARLKLDGAGAADLKYATLLGGSNQDNLFAVAVDPINPELVTLAGRSWSDDFPTTPGVIKPTNPPFSPLFATESGVITRFRFPAAGGGSHLWSTYFGLTTSRGGASVSDVVVNEAGEAIVAGRTSDPDFPTTRGALDRTMAGIHGGGDEFLARISPDATQILYASFFGGSDGEQDTFRISPLLAHAGGNTVIVAGVTDSTDFPVTTAAFDTTHNNPDRRDMPDAYVVRATLEPDASGDLTVDVPVLVSPADGAAFSGNGGLARLEWAAVSDVSGIEAYEFEMSSRSDFHPDFIQYRGSVRETHVVLPPPRTGETGLALVPWHWRVRAADAAGNLSDWSLARSFSLGVAGASPSVLLVQISPGSIVGGQSATGVIHLNEPAPAGGTVATLSVDYSRGPIITLIRATPVPVSVPPTVTIPAGAITAPFSIASSAVPETVPVDILATIGGVGRVGTITVKAAGPVVDSAEIRPRMVTGGTPATGTVILKEPAPAGGMPVTLRSSHPLAASVPPSVTVPAGSTTTTFPVTTASVDVPIDPIIEVRAGGETYLAYFYVRPASSFALSGLTLDMANASGGTVVTGTLTFTQPVPPQVWPATGNALVNLVSSDPAAVPLVSLVTIPAGATSGTFSFMVRSVPVTTTVTISASFDAVTVSAPLTVNAGPPVTLSSVTFNQTTLTGGQGTIGFARLASAAPPGGITVALVSSDPSVVPVAASVVISAGTTSGAFPVNTKPVGSATSVTITATYG
ncbi:MAG: hypothetical protein ACE5Q3_13365, partial [Alphaproteobacteria bacterium]